METLRYAENMADSITETPKVADVTPRPEASKGITRRNLLAGAATGGVLAGATFTEKQTGVFSKTAGAIVRAIEVFFNRQTEDQINAAKEIERQDIPKFNFEVTNHPDIQQNQGLAVRKEARVPLKGEPGTAIYRLQPGYKIMGAIEWVGKNYTNIGRQGDFSSWLAFKDNQGRIGFVANKEDYLKKLTEPSNP